MLRMKWLGKPVHSRGDPRGRPLTVASCHALSVTISLTYMQQLHTPLVCGRLVRSLPLLAVLTRLL